MSDPVERAKQLFQDAQDYDSSSRAERMDDLRFCALSEQWPSWSVRDRNQPGKERPMLTINRMRGVVQLVTNDLISGIPAIKAVPVDDVSDPKTADGLTEILRHIQQRSNAKSAFALALSPMVREGIGYVKVGTRYVDDESFDVEPVILAVPNPFSVYFDPNSLLMDGSDAERALIAEDMSRAEFERRYPGVKTSSDFPEGMGDSRGWNTKEQVRIAEFYEIVTEESGYLVLLQDGRTVQVQGLTGVPAVAARPMKAKKCVWYKIAGSQILEQGEFPSKRIPIVPFIGNRTIYDGKQYIEGMARVMKSSQIQYNYQQSAMTEMIGYQPLAPYIAAAGQVEKYMNDWAKANRLPLPVLVYDPVTIAGNLAPPPQRQPFAQIPAGAFNLLQIAIDDMKAVVGQFDASLGAKEVDQSGRAIIAQQRQGDDAVAHYMMHRDLSITHVGRILLDMIPKLYTKPTVLKILGEDGELKTVNIDPSLQQSSVNVEGQVEAILNPAIGQYDITITTGPSYETRRQEGAALLTDLVSKYPALMERAGDLVIGAIDAPMADKLAERIRPPDVATGEGVTPEVQRMRQQMEQLMQTAEQLQAMLADKRAAEEREAEKAEIEKFDAMTRRLSALSGVWKTEADIKTQKVEVAGKIQEIVNQESDGEEAEDKDADE